MYSVFLLFTLSYMLLTVFSPKRHQCSFHSMYTQWSTKHWLPYKYMLAFLYSIIYKL